MIARMGRPTIRDLAQAAEVSVSTVNRVIGGHGGVRDHTMRRVLSAAEAIGFYGAAAIRQRLAAPSKRYDFAVLLLQPDRSFYQAVGRALEQAAREIADAEVNLGIVFIDDLSPEYTAERMVKLGARSDGLAVVTAEHPRIDEAVATLASRGVPVFSLISPLSGWGAIGYVGLDGWKVGRTAGWAFDRFCATPGKIGILVGNHRYRCQLMNESGFRSYFRENRRGFLLL